MKPRCSKQRDRALNLFEVMLVVSVVVVVALVFLMSFANTHRHRNRGYCVNNLKQVGLAYRIWAGDNDDKYPMQVSITNGGAMEYIGVENWRVFQVMSNELSTPKILNCPQDKVHSTYATNFSDDLKGKISFFVGLDVKDNDPQAVFSGDANLVINGAAVTSGIWDLQTNSVTWTKARHERLGYILMADGSVQGTMRIGGSASTGMGIITNRLALP